MYKTPIYSQRILDDSQNLLCANKFASNFKDI